MKASYYCYDKIINIKPKYGIVESVKDHIVILKGLEKVQVGELVNFLNPMDESIQGYAMNIESDSVRVVLIKGRQEDLREGNFGYRAYKLPTTRAGFGILGQIITPLGVLMNKSDFTNSGLLNVKLCSTDITDIFRKSPTIIDREPIGRPFMFGVTSVDCFLPVGCGQRELIIGDNNTGKTSLAVTAILNQRWLNNIYYKRWRAFEDRSSLIREHMFSDFRPCIYVFIGKRRSEGVRLKNVFQKYKTFNYISFVFSSSDDLASIQYLAPYAGTALGEWFRERGYNAGVVYDDLSEHAVAYRQISLLLRRPPGREAYPGDIFFIQARLLERSSQLNRKLSGGSVTSLPIIETKGGDISGYIPTNVISITDGQVFLSSRLFNDGFKPAVDLGLSVSRVGSKAQYSCMKDVSKKVKLDYAMYKAYASLAKVSTDLDPILLRYIARGVRVNSFFVQGLYETVRLSKQVVALYAFGKGYMDKISPESISQFFKIFYSGFFLDRYVSNVDLEHSTLFLDISNFYGDSLGILESGLIVNSFSPYESMFAELILSFREFFSKVLSVKINRSIAKLNAVS